MAKPSHDRVRFFLSEHRVRSNWREFHELLQFALDATAQQVIDLATYQKSAYFNNPCNGTYIVCRPSQFARFLIKRNELGLNNGFKELSPELFVPEPKQPSELDVSRRTHKDPRLGHGSGVDDEEYL